MLVTLRTRLKNQKGFTLIELLVVISIIGVLAAIGVPKFMDTTASARTAKVQAELGAIDSAIQIYGADHAGTLTSNTALIAPYMNGNKMPVATAGNYKIGNRSALVNLANDAEYTINATTFEATIKLDQDYTASSLTAEIAKPAKTN